MSTSFINTSFHELRLERGLVRQRRGAQVRNLIEVWQRIQSGVVAAALQITHE